MLLSVNIDFLLSVRRHGYVRDSQNDLNLNAAEKSTFEKYIRVHIYIQFHMIIIYIYKYTYRNGGKLPWVLSLLQCLGKLYIFPMNNLYDSETVRLFFNQQNYLINYVQLTATIENNLSS